METENNMNKSIEEEKQVNKNPLEMNPALLEVNVTDSVTATAVGPGQC